jgi:pyruvate dehydrogenase E2 component (dihydrolipoamide acetyltransferase)
MTRESARVSSPSSLSEDPSKAPRSPEGAQTTARGEPTFVELSRAELAAARRIAEAKAIVPHLYAMAEATPAAEREPAIEPVDLLIRASALALREHPRVNSSYRDGTVSEHSRINVAFELVGGEAPLAPVITDADRHDVATIAARRAALADRAAAGTITAPELAGATFTVSAIAADGVRSMLAAVHPPQVAILAAGTARIAAGDGPASLGLSLAFDGRVLDGGRGSAFLARVCELLENPSAPGS